MNHGVSNMFVSNIGRLLGEFIAYSQFVPVIRLTIMAIGCMLIAVALVIKLLKRNQPSYNLLPDVLFLRYFTYVLVALPVLCFWLSAISMCDFLCFQMAASVTLFIAGSRVALRIKSYRYVVLYFFLTLFLCGWGPAI